MYPLMKEVIAKFTSLGREGISWSCYEDYFGTDSYKMNQIFMSFWNDPVDIAKEVKIFLYHTPVCPVSYSAFVGICCVMLCDMFQVLPLNVLIPKSKVTDKNRKWYNALKKVWHHKDPWQSFQLSELPEKSAIRHR